MKESDENNAKGNGQEDYGERAGDLDDNELDYFCDLTIKTTTTGKENRKISFIIMVALSNGVCSVHLVVAMSAWTVTWIWTGLNMVVEIGSQVLNTKSYLKVDF